MSRLSAALFAACVLVPSVRAEPLPGTKPLTAEGDLAMQMVAGIDQYLTRALAASVKERERFWKEMDFSSDDTRYSFSVEPNRQRLKKILGVRGSGGGATPSSSRARAILTLRAELASKP